LPTRFAERRPGLRTHQQRIGRQQRQWQRRGQMRCVNDGRYKFARYFKATDHHRPRDWATLNARNDLALYDLQADPGETNYMAADRAAVKDTPLAMNAKLDRLIEREIGVDDGSSLPGPGLLWRRA
jgi:arylsulfatase